MASKLEFPSRLTPPTQAARYMPFRCNVCGCNGIFSEAHFINPELPSCANCRSNVRFRWIVHRLSCELFGCSIPLPDFPANPSIRGIGLTDPAPLAAVLAERFTYRNTYLTAEPRLDIRCDPSPVGDLDFLIASEVFEHVEPPVMAAFHNAARLLKPSGFLLFTSPWVWDGDPHTAIPELFDWTLARDGERYLIVNRTADGREERFCDMVYDGGPGPSLGRTREHFPNLKLWRLVENSGTYLLINTREDGTVETFSNLVFHEGPGLALEMRLFTKNGIEQSLRAAGFSRVDFEFQDVPEIGIIFGQPWSRPLIAWKAQ
jgi:SAM-dependent methyltransferase